MLEKSSVVFLGGKILHKGLGTKDFFWGKKHQSCHILEEKKSLKSPYLDNIFFKTKQDPKKNLLYYLTSNHQIWLIRLVDDCKSTYLLKLGGKKKNPV
jgi:hypothetical protein